MKPLTWLKALIAAYPRYEMADLQVEEYLLELRKWVLTDDQWLEVRSIAKRRHTFFPSYAELDEIMREVRREDRTRVTTDQVFETWEGEDGKWYAWPRSKGPRPVKRAS